MVEEKLKCREVMVDCGLGKLRAGLMIFCDGSPRFLRMPLRTWAGPVMSLDHARALRTGNQLELVDRESVMVKSTASEILDRVISAARHHAPFCCGLLARPAPFELSAKCLLDPTRRANPDPLRFCRQKRAIKTRTS